MRAMKGRMPALLMSMLLVLSVVGMFGCSQGPSAEELVRADLSAQLDQIKNMDEETVESMTQAMESSMGDQAAYLELLGIGPSELTDAMLSGFDYTIDKVTVAGDTAMAKVTVTTKNFATFMGEMMNILSRVQEDPERYAGMNETQILTSLGDEMKQALSDMPLKESTTEFEYTEKDGTWEMSPSSYMALLAPFIS